MQYFKRFFCFNLQLIMAELPMEVIQHIFDFLPLQEIHRLRKDPQLNEVLQ